MVIRYIDSDEEYPVYFLKPTGLRADIPYNVDPLLVEAMELHRLQGRWFQRTLEYQHLATMQRGSDQPQRYDKTLVNLQALLEETKRGLHARGSFGVWSLNRTMIIEQEEQ